ncbi:HK97 family phage prohead protease [Clostridioides difficile]|uniref:HK97 family phage prohead protease n=1 Tax=Clostridioides difficile TaxID=1496 RepID=UPI00107E7D4D|nr:HK97 family phage prohead protease [Clostridioides difficile]EGT4645246.1 HK97 family phage prohead protease [Clostridioides difficile]EGT4739756.1 HK97 family phage prohead protease [Clostridioides difficile]MCA0881419.1 HK97 family phage prohead protease [Clostridioides difficile]MCE4764744.1 HK97 family phage prohead protease [Clostridioides difficile]MCR1682104.1 HK97 family phage prohead protease [Clostridioides difficile]
MEMEKRAVSLEIRESNLESRKISGYAAVFSDDYTKLQDRWGDTFYEKISRGAFLKTLADNARDKFMLINHDWNKVVGRTNSNLVLEEDEHGLRFELDIPYTTHGNDLLENVRLGLIKGCSFGFNIVNSKTRWDDDWTFYRDITEVELFEITATPIPAYNDTEINCRSDISIKELRESQKEEAKQNDNKDNIEKRNVDLVSAFFNAFNKGGK